MGKLFTIMGKSATGKDHVFRDVVAKCPVPLQIVVPYTTRPKRAKETEGVEYHFVSEDKMKSLTEAGKVIECRRYDTVSGPWYYFTVEDGQIDLAKASSIVICTPEAYEQIQKFYGKDKVVPLYIEVDDHERLLRSLKREAKQASPNYKEVCRRFLADSEDFAEETLERLGITKRFANVDFETCVNEVIAEVVGKV